MFVGYFLPTGNDVVLAHRLQTLVDALPPDRFGNCAYVEFDRAWPGVRIRHLTHLPVGVVRSLMADADRHYRAVLSLGSRQH